jgi:hypothetical protein
MMMDEGERAIAAILQKRIGVAGGAGLWALPAPVPPTPTPISCERCGVLWDPIDTISTWESTLEPGSLQRNKHITRALIKMEATSDGMFYTCGVCGNEWHGPDPLTVALTIDPSIDESSNV